jgi:molecular chaperone DnaJ
VIDPYQVLGVARTASEEDVRVAYRRLARQRHPDRTGGDAGPMAILNEAYRVLGDPARRAAYDGAQRHTVAAGSAAPPAEPRPQPVGAPAASQRAPDTTVRFPWRMSLVAAGLGTMVVLVMAAVSEPADPPPPDNILGPGSCVEVIESEAAVFETVCGDSARFEVRELVPAGDPCPAGTTGYRDRQGLGTACIEPRQ